jgi:hypothetical protein
MHELIVMMMNHLWKVEKWRECFFSYLQFGFSEFVLADEFYYLKSVFGVPQTRYPDVCHSIAILNFLLDE